jgi:hypothetical protein
MSFSIYLQKKLNLQKFLELGLIRIDQESCNFSEIMEFSGISRFFSSSLASSGLFGSFEEFESLRNISARIFKILQQIFKSFSILYL